MSTFILIFAVVLLMGSKRAMEYFIVLILCYLYPPVAIIAGLYVAGRLYYAFKKRDRRLYEK